MDTGSASLGKRPTLARRLAANSPQPKPPGRCSTVARGNSSSERNSGSQQNPGPKSVTVNHNIARQLGGLIGLDLASASLAVVQETLRSLPNNSPPPTGSARRYPERSSTKEDWRILLTTFGQVGDADSDTTDDDDPVISNKTGIGRYPGTRGKVASRAIPLLLCTASTRGVYQSTETTIRWAKKAYKHAWEAFRPDIEFKECPYDLLQTIALQMSNLQTDIKKRIRKFIEHLFDFIPGTSDAVMRHNKSIVDRLSHNTFHCKELIVDKDQYKNPVFIRALCEAYFWSSDTFLLKDRKTLDALTDDGLPLKAVALVLTLGLLNYRTGAAGRLAGFQLTWFKSGLEYAGVKLHEADEDNDGFCQSVTRVENVRPDSPRFGEEYEEEEEEEPELGPDGRYTAQSKGKFAR
ncbi:hypothetical protein FRC12_019870, partial [Ceratobasidium sp. 428]